MMQSKLTENSSINYLFVRDINQNNISNVFIEFQYSVLDAIYFYSFQRPVTEGLQAFLKKIKTKLSQLKYTKTKKKLKKVDLQYFDGCDIKLLCNNEEVETENITILDFINSDNILSINGLLYTIWRNPIWIKSCLFPEFFFANCPIIPEIDIINGECSELKYCWYVRDKNDNWSLVSNEFYFIPSHKQVDTNVKLEITSPTNLSKQNFVLISENNIVPLPKSEYAAELELANMSISSEESLRIVTYNILSKSYASTSSAKKVLYRHCKPQFLLAKYRFPLIMQELLSFNADLILLQEVDRSFYHKNLQPLFLLKGYESIYQMKSSNANEGSAIFWRKSLYELAEDACISSFGELLQAAESDPNVDCIRRYLTQNPDLEQRWHGLGQAMSGCLLRPIKDAAGRSLLVLNNHLFYHPKYEAFRLFQIFLVLMRATSIRQRDPECAVVVSGDFNASYEDATIQFVMDGRTELCPEASTTQQTITVTHSLYPLQSAFQGHVDFTNFTPDYVGILDHIFYDQRTLKPLHLHKLPSKTQIELNRALPNKFHPSDHLPLIADFVIL